VVRRIDTPQLHRALQVHRVIKLKPKNKFIFFEFGQ